MEIERKFLIEELPFINLENYKQIIQGYISIDPEIRIRNIDNSEYYLTKKGNGNLVREEIETKINNQSFNILSSLIKGRIICKTRYYIPLSEYLIAELDVYCGELEGLITVEVEFSNENIANEFNIPNWFGAEITDNKQYKNKNLAMCSNDDLKSLIKGTRNNTLMIKK